MLHIIDKAKQPLQLLLRNVLMDTTHAMTGAAAAIASQERKVYDQSLQMAIVTIATVPILLVYPFVQKYFTKGTTLAKAALPLPALRLPAAPRSPVSPKHLIPLQST